MVLVPSASRSCDGPWAGGGVGDAEPISLVSLWRETVPPSSAVPVKVGRAMLLMLSPRAPLSLDGTRVGVVVSQASFSSWQHPVHAFEPREVAIEADHRRSMFDSKRSKMRVCC